MLLKFEQQVQLVTQLSPASTALQQAVGLRQARNHNGHREACQGSDSLAFAGNRQLTGGTASGA